MEIWMWALILFIISQRIIELIIAKRNERWMMERGGIETGQEHYKWFLIVHSMFFISIFLEVIITNQSENTLNIYLMSLFILTQIGRVWCIFTLGKFWNTKVITLPYISLIRKGPYKYVKHPNYIIVGIELIIIPLLFGANVTAIIFLVLHIILLLIRIPAENKALGKTFVQNTE